MIQWMLAIWSLVPLPFIKPAWTSGSSRFTYCWSLAWRTHTARPSTHAPPTHTQAQLISSELWDPGTGIRILTEPTPLLQACRLRCSQKAEIQALVSPVPASRLALFWGGRPSLGPAVLGELSQDISICLHVSAPCPRGPCPRKQLNSEPNKSEALLIPNKPARFYCLLDSGDVRRRRGQRVHSPRRTQMHPLTR